MSQLWGEGAAEGTVGEIGVFSPTQSCFLLSEVPKATWNKSAHSLEHTSSL